VGTQANNARHLFPQLRPDYASPRDLTDVRIRKALMYAMDRTESAETAAADSAQVVYPYVVRKGVIGATPGSPITPLPTSPTSGTWTSRERLVIRRGGHPGRARRAG
jgi:ABC-type transport system substrate-binding protein